MQSRKPMLLAAALLSGLMLAGCATMGSQETSTTLSIPCDALSPIEWSHKDTVETQRQVVGYNAVGKKLCKWRGHVNWHTLY